MSDPLERHASPASSRRRYKDFVRDYRLRRLDDPADEKPAGGDGAAPRGGGKRREHLREYLRWLRPHRSAVAVLFVLALAVAGLEMIEPLFMRFMIDRDRCGWLERPLPGVR